MSSPADQLASVKTIQATPVSTTANLAQTSSTTEVTEQSAIAAQAQADANSLDPAMYDQASAVAIEPGADPMARKNISATQNSIFSTANSQVSNAEPAQGGPVNAMQNDLAAGQTMNAAQNSIYAGSTDVATRGISAIPLPNASTVAEVQDLALAGMDVPPEMQAAAADAVAQLNANNSAASNPAAALSQKAATENADTTQVAAVPAETVETTPTVKVAKKRRTLADFFRKNTETASFDNDRFGQKRTREINTASIPNMQTAALADDSLPGVNTNAMFPVQSMPGDEDHEGESEPAGLMKLASLSGMARVAPNGIWTQTDKVEVRCLRPQLVRMLKQVENHYGKPVVVSSGYRDPGHNRRAGGVRHSLHTLCAAADIQVEGVSKWQLADYLRSIPGRGGVGTYCHTESVHIDVGGERDWNWRCRRKKFRRG